LPTYCKQCGAQLHPETQYCAYCGRFPKTAADTRRTVLFIGIVVLSGVVVFSLTTTCLLLGPCRVKSSDTIYITRDLANMDTHQRIYTKPDEISAALGVELYPAVLSSPGAAKSTQRAGTMVTAYFTTDDPKDKVVAFYAAKYPDRLSLSDQGTSATLVIKLADHDSVMITVTSHSTPDENQTHLFFSRSTRNS